MLQVYSLVYASLVNVPYFVTRLLLLVSVAGYDSNAPVFCTKNVLFSVFALRQGWDNHQSKERKEERDAAQEDDARAAMLAQRR